MGNGCKTDLCVLCDVGDQYLFKDYSSVQDTSLTGSSYVRGSASSSGSSDTAGTTWQPDLYTSPPLFLHLVCSVSVQPSSLQSMPVRSIPMCFGTHFIFIFFANLCSFTSFYIFVCIIYINGTSKNDSGGFDCQTAKKVQQRN
jgi:hypothetical protein